MPSGPSISSTTCFLRRPAYDGHRSLGEDDLSLDHCHDFPADVVLRGGIVCRRVEIHRVISSILVDQRAPPRCRRAFPLHDREGLGHLGDFAFEEVVAY